MCGFIFTNKPVDDVQRVNRYIQLRGPDHTSEIHRGSYTFIHNLLSITGAFTPQPTMSDDQAVFCLFNGEIYNFQEFGEFENDALCLIPLYQAHGPAFTRHLDGEFAIVLVDFSANCLVVSTDVFATKPLWMAIEGRRVGLASYASALLELGFAHPEKLPANTTWVFALEELSLQERFTVFDFDPRHQEKTGCDDWTAAFQKAIRKRAVRNVREKIFIGLSSGYDSGSIACELSVQQVPFKAYTLMGRENPKVLAERHARIRPHAEMELLPDDPAVRNATHGFLMAHVESFYYRIYSGSSNYNEFNLDLRDDHGATSLGMVAVAARRDGRKIYLSGQGADEIFADYGFNGHKIYPHSNFGGRFPEDLAAIFPWPSFYDSSMLSYLAKEEYVAGAYGLEARYPFLDPAVVQEFLWLSSDLKNKWYKSVLHHYLVSHDFPMGVNQKFGF
ncbi:MAG: asparagine synthetase B [Desulfobacteraceae bacterium]|nr:MAG: asparagine synthetase B [Desulfobacteraceae bacterium]